MQTNTKRMLGLLLWFAFLLLCYAPPFAVLLTGSPGTADGDGAFSFFSGRRTGLLLNSFLLAVLVACTAMGLALPLALALWRAPARAARHARWLLVSWIVVPPCVQAMAWLHIWRQANGLLAACGLAELPLTGWCAAGVLQTLTFLPLAVVLAWLGFDAIDAELLQAARMQRSETTVLLRIALPLAAPGLLAGGGLVCLLSLLDYSLPSLCGVTAYTLDLFAEYSARGNARQALCNALPLMLTGAAVVWFSQAAFRNAASTARRDATVTSSDTGATCSALLRWSGLAFLLLLPLLTLIWMAAKGHGLGAAWFAARDASWVSLRTALLAALCALPPALAVAETLCGSDWRSHIAWLLATIPLALPPPLVGIGWAALANRIDWPLHGSSALPVLAALTRFLPVAALVLVIARRRLDPLLWDAARVFQANPWQGLWRVRLPLLRRGILAAGALMVALTLGELGATLIVVPPGECTLTMRLYNFLHYGASAHVAALGLLLAALAILAGAAIGWLFDAGSRGRSSPMSGWKA